MLKRSLRTIFLAAVGLLLFGGISQSPVSAIAPANTGWMFTIGSWANPSANYNNVTNSWRVVDGSPYHYGSDFYAQDWNWGSGSADWGKEVRAPIGGTVIWAASVANGYGKSVVIRWDTDGNYAWRAAHLSTIAVTKGARVYTGALIGTVGNSTGTTETLPHHLHSVFYKNITQMDGSETALAKLEKGGSLGGTSQGTAPNNFAYSQCERVTSSSITLFNSTQCLGSATSFGVVSLYNFPSSSDNTTKSISVPAGRSVRVYSDFNKIGASKCLTPGNHQNLQRVLYDNGTRIVPQDTGDGLGTISSIEVFNNTGCFVDGMTFDSHVNYPVGASVKVGANFTKIWKLRNTGTTTWQTNYQVAFVSGEQLGGLGSIALPATVAPGATIDVSVNLKAPNSLGTKTGYWALRNASGSNIGSNLTVSVNLVSACPGVLSSSIILFDQSDCIGNTRAFPSVGSRNLSDFGFDNAPRAIYVPSGMSVKVYEHANRDGSSRCISWTMYNLASDYYTSGNTGLVIAGTVSSIEVFLNGSCYTPPTSNCPTFSAPGVVPFSDYECKGSAPYYYPANGWWNLDALNNNTRSLYVPAGKSVRLYEGNNRGGWTKCVNTTLYDMRKDYYNATSVQLVSSNGDANLSSMEVFDNTSCSPPSSGCQNYNTNAVVLFADPNCGGDRRYFAEPGFRNIPELDFNDKASAIYIPNGWSVKVYEHDNRQGSWSCYNTIGGLWDLNQDWYQSGNTSLRLNDTISSMQVYTNRSCL